MNDQELINRLSDRPRRIVDRIRDYVQRNVWDNRLFVNHIPVHGTEVGDELLITLESIVDALSGENVLSETELMLLVSAAYLYQVGLQIVDRSRLPAVIEDTFNASPLELEPIRANFRKFSAEAIRRKTVDLGIEDRDDDIRFTLAAICGVGSIDELESIPDMDLVSNRQVRPRLIAEILLLADQLYLSPKRVSVHALQKADGVDLQVRTHFWVQVYTRGVFIANAYIRTQFDLAEEHYELKEAVQTHVFNYLTEINKRLFKLIRTTVGDRPTTHAVASKPLMPEDIQEFLRRVLRPASHLHSMFVDYEGIVTFIGRHNVYDLSAKEIIIRLVRNAGQVDQVYIYCDADRFHADREEIMAHLPQQFRHITFQIRPSPVEKNGIQHSVTQDTTIAAQNGTGQKFTIVCTQNGLETTVQNLNKYGQVVVWAPGGKIEQGYRAVTLNVALLENQLNLNVSDVVASQVERNRLQLIGIIVDHMATERQRQAFLFEDLIRSLEQCHDRIFRQSQWWANLSVSEGIVIRSDSRVDNRTRYRLNISEVRVQEAFELRQQILEAAAMLIEKMEQVNQEQLHALLKTSRKFSSSMVRNEWLEVMLALGLIKEGGRDKQPQNAPVIPGQRHLRQLIMVIDNYFIVNDSHTYVTPKNVKEGLQRHNLDQKIVQATFNQAAAEGLIQFDQKTLPNGNTITVMYLLRDNPRIIEYLATRNRIICIAHDWLRDHDFLTSVKLAELLENRGIGDSDIERTTWIEILEKEGVLAMQGENTLPRYAMDYNHLTTRHVLIGHYINTLIEIIVEFRPSERYKEAGVRWVIDQLTHHGPKARELAQAVFEFARRKKMIDETRGSIDTARPEIQQNYLKVSPRQLSVWETRLAEEEDTIRSRLVNLLEKQDVNRFSRSELLKLMAASDDFGMVNAERAFWIKRMQNCGVLERNHHLRNDTYSLKL